MGTGWTLLVQGLRDAGLNSHSWGEEINVVQKIWHPEMEIMQQLLNSVLI